MVDWALARQIARFAAGSSAGAPPLDADFPTLVRESEAHLRDYTGLELSAPVPAPEPVGRAEWAEVNLESLAALLEPVSTRLRTRLDSTGPPDHPSGQAVASRLLSQRTSPVGSPDGRFHPLPTSASLPG